MKKIFEIIGLGTLICFSFFYTEKVGYVVKELDNLMIEIKDKSQKYELQPINAKIINNTIIPGTYGKKIDINESYKKMKRINEYNDNLLVYESVKPEISIEKIYDKYVIGGNKNLKQVSIIIIVKDNTDINYIRNLAISKNVKFNFFINGSWLEDNNDFLIELIKEGHNIGNLSYNSDYSNSYFIWMDTILKKIVKQKRNYCYLETEKEEYLKICALNKNYTIKPSIVIKSNPTLHIQKSIENGSIISLEASNNNVDELQIAINYIINRGYKVVSLNELLSEK